MSDCGNVETRERLPELLHGRLEAGERARVEAHLETCAQCRRELELLRRVRQALVAPQVDTARISAQLPAYRRAPAWRRAVASSQLRAAAAVLLVAGAIAVATGGGDQPRLPGDVGSTSAAGPTTRVASVAAAELPVGEPLADLTESDLHALIDEIEEIDAVTPAEGDVELPTLRGGE